MGNINETTRSETGNVEFTMMYLTFHIAGQHYGIPIGNVLEILQIQPATELPELPYYYKGIVNLRGRLIPLIDVNLRFGKPEKEYTNRTCIIIADIEGLYTGLIVEAVEEVLEIDSRMTCAPPAYSGDHSPGFITGVAKPGNSMILLLDVRMLVSGADVD